MDPQFGHRTRSYRWSEDVLVDLFTAELDGWGEKRSDGQHVSDPFLLALIPRRVQFEQLRTILETFETLDDLLAISPRELRAIKGIGPKTVQAISDELSMRGLSLREDAR